MTYHPLWSFSGVIATRLRLGVIARYHRSQPNQSAGNARQPSGPCTTGPIFVTRVMVISLIMHAESRSFDRAPLMRFGPLQHSLAALRCSRLPAIEQSRFGVSCDRPRCADS